MLSAKLQSGESSIANNGPDQLLSFGGSFAQLATVRQCLCRFGIA
jgi:hypothetical protein